MQTNIQDTIRASTNPAFDQPEKDFLVTSLDLISAVVQALDSPRIGALIAGSRPNLFELLPYCMQDGSDDVRQSAYALLGDCAIYVFPQIQQYLPSIMAILIEQMDLREANRHGEGTGYSVINNACWSVGEIAMRQREGMQPYMDNLLQKLGTILYTPGVPESLIENAAIALGRLGIGCPQLLAPHLTHIAQPFINAISHVAWTDEKGHALKGFAQIVLCNPGAMEKPLLSFFLEMSRAPKEFLNGPGEPVNGYEDRPYESLKQVSFPRRAELHYALT